VAGCGVRQRFADDLELLAAHGHLDLLDLGDDPAAQHNSLGPAGLSALRADLHPLLCAGHRVVVVNRRCPAGRGVIPDDRYINHVQAALDVDRFDVKSR